MVDHQRAFAIPLAHNAAMRAAHHVYVIELCNDVLVDAKFTKCNPGDGSGMPCVYVGMPGLDPDVRFDNHKAGIRANKYAMVDDNYLGRLTTTMLAG
jgi:hypothetical protein